MSKEIRIFSSNLFYNNKLEDGEKKVDIILTNLKKNILFVDIECSKELREEQNTSIYNEIEAKFVVELLYELKIETGVNEFPFNSVGIISPYKKQVRHIKNLIQLSKRSNNSPQLDFQEPIEA